MLQSNKQSLKLKSKLTTNVVHLSTDFQTLLSAYCACAKQKPTNERVAVAIELGLVLALGRLDHEGARHRPRHGRRVEAVVLEPLGDVDRLHPARLLEDARVQDELVSAEAVRSAEEDLNGERGSVC